MASAIAEEARHIAATDAPAAPIPSTTRRSSPTRRASGAAAGQRGHPVAEHRHRLAGQEQQRGPLPARGKPARPRPASAQPAHTASGYGLAGGTGNPPGRQTASTLDEGDDGLLPGRVKPRDAWPCPTATRPGRRTWVRLPAAGDRWRPGRARPDGGAAWAERPDPPDRTAGLRRGVAPAGRCGWMSRAGQRDGMLLCGRGSPGRARCGPGWLDATAWPPAGRPPGP
jgi:hypothetical protein